MCSSILSFKMVNVKEAEILLQDTIEDTEQKIHISDSNIRKSNDQLMDSLEEPEQGLPPAFQVSPEFKSSPRILSPSMMEIFRCPPKFSNTVPCFCKRDLSSPKSFFHLSTLSDLTTGKRVYLQAYQTNM